MLEKLIEQYGYAAIYIGTLFEGEISLIVAGYLAHESLLNFWGVVFVGVLGAITGDNIWYFVAKKRGGKMLTRTPRIQAKAEALSNHLRINSPLMMFGSHFFIGFRSLIAIMIALKGVPQRQFALYNLLGSSVWALLVCCLGYLFGTQIEEFVGKLSLIEGVLIALTVMVVLVGLIRGIEALWLKSS